MSAFPNGNSFSHGRFPSYAPVYYPVDSQATAPTQGVNAGPIYQCYPVQPAPTKTGFSLWNAVKETVKGVFRPITPLIKHPFQSALAIGATVLVASAAPVTVPFMILAGLGLGGYQTVQGVRSVWREYRQGNYEAAEKAFGQIGEGGFSLVSSLLGVRQAGVISAEARASNAALRATASAAEKIKAVEAGIKAAKTVQAGSWSNALRETVSMLSPGGLKATATQLNPIRLVAIARGKIQAFIALFQQNPVVDMKAAVRTAQRRLGISDTDMPEFTPHMEIVTEQGSPKGLSGAYLPKTHTVHLEPDRWKAYRELLGPLGDSNPLNRLPRPIQRFLGNLHKHSASATELATHEMTHARQFIQVRQLSMEQARQVVQTAFPEQSPEAVRKFLELLSFKGHLGQTVRHKAGEKYLLSSARQHFQSRHLIKAMLKDPSQVRIFQTRHKLWNTYMRSVHEVEARQFAAQALLDDAARQLGNARDIYRNHSLLKQYRAARIELQLNKLLAKFNRLEKFGLLSQAARAEQQLRPWMQIQQTRTSTYKYLHKEQVLQAQTQGALAYQRLKAQTGAVTSGQTGFFTAVKNFVGGIVSRIVRFFTPRGLQQFEQANHSLRPGYVAANRCIDQQRKQARHPIFA